MTTETTTPPVEENQIIAERRSKLKAIREQGIASVSYTHLTLPTIYSV